jgi:hypothetical protein
MENIQNIPVVASLSGMFHEKENIAFCTISAATCRCADADVLLSVFNA